MGWEHVAQGLGAEEAGEGVPLHGLEDVFLSVVEELGVDPSFLFNGIRDGVERRLGKDDFAFAAGQEVCVEDLLRRGLDVRSTDAIRVARIVLTR